MKKNYTYKAGAGRAGLMQGTEKLSRLWQHQDGRYIQGKLS